MSTKNKEPFIAQPSFEKLEGHALIGDKQCVTLVKSAILGMPHASQWKQGEKVKGNLDIKKGTAIATFFNGVYPSHRHGNHAALYISQDALGIWVIDQFKSPDDQFQKINRRRLKFGNPKTSSNGDLFSVIEA
jgi:hypothetical protein